MLGGILYEEPTPQPSYETESFAGETVKYANFRRRGFAGELLGANESQHQNANG
jgi:hypothetical protein